MNLVFKSLGITAAIFGGLALVGYIVFLIITYLGLGALLGLFFFALVFTFVYDQVRWNAKDAEREAAWAKRND